MHKPGNSWPKGREAGFLDSVTISETGDGTVTRSPVLGSLSEDPRCGLGTKIGLPAEWDRKEGLTTSLKIVFPQRFFAFCLFGKKHERDLNEISLRSPRPTGEYWHRNRSVGGCARGLQSSLPTRQAQPLRRSCGGERTHADVGAFPKAPTLCNPGALGCQPRSRYSSSTTRHPVQGSRVPLTPGTA